MGYARRLSRRDGYDPFVGWTRARSAPADDLDVVEAILDALTETREAEQREPPP
ncbi:hypothetical protein [Rhodococcus koreensis]